jgi:hypothetical protein
MAVGIDHGGTSRQGLAYLRKVVDEIVIYHDNSADQRTFHPKLYLFESRSKAIVILGSGNLTAGGLFTNYESHVRVELSLDTDTDRDLYTDLIAKCEPYFDQGSECVRPLTDELFAELVQVLPDETMANRKGFGEKESEDEATLTDDSPEDNARSRLLGRLFGSSKFARAPRPAISVPRTTRVAPDISVKQASTPPSASLPRFYKTLSAFDVSETSAPGQIVIPIMFRRFFEPLPLTKAGDDGKGRQWDATFPVEFIDANFRRTVEARCIVYEPEKDHPRPNTECRFTFRDHDILKRLSVADILEFRQTGLPTPRFVVEKFAASDSRNHVLRATGKYRWL